MDGNGFDDLTRRLANGRSRRSVLRGLVGGGAALVAARTGASLAARPEKVLICHYTSSTTNPYNIIEVSANAVPAHEAHGDHVAFDCGEGPTCTACFPEACAPGTVGVVYGDPWTVCRADAASAWLSAASGGVYDPVAACQSLGYASAGQYGGTCGNICGYCQEPTSCDNPGNEYYDGAGDCGSGTICSTVQWQCLA